MTIAIVIQVFTFIERTSMYKYEIKVTENGVTFYDDVWADNSRDAIETGECKYPLADFVELA